MHIVILSHPEFLGHQSMPRYTKMLSKGMVERGHSVQVWCPQPKMFKLAFHRSLAKWFGYIDQYLLFPQTVKKRIKGISRDTLFVFMDHALGPWVHLVANRPHAIHCHDFLAQRSALGELVQARTGFMGRVYQRMIRKGYVRGENFISVSRKTKTDLHRFLRKPPLISEVVYNGMNRHFELLPVISTRNDLGQSLGIELSKGYILHVGGNQWYKNRSGVLEIFEAFRKYSETDLPLLLVGEKPDDILKNIRDNSLFKNDIHFLTACNDDMVNKAYAGASLLLYPSHEEGFGWPIAEAMASGCPVITTKEAPMVEVADKAGFYITKRPFDSDGKKWATEAATVIKKVLALSDNERDKSIQAGIENVKRFDEKKALDSIEAIYTKIVNQPNQE